MTPPLTLFSHFKPFRGHFGVIQRNAVRSWARLEPRPEILLFGEAEGTAEMAAEVGARHIPRVRRGPHGAALMNGLFEQAAEEASNELLGFVNGDIILASDLPAALGRLPFRRYMAVGRRTELELDAELDFGGDWRAELDRRIAAGGWLQGDVAIDYFMFPRRLVRRLAMPDLAIGRPRWDNWTLYRVRALGLPLVDLTSVVRAVHQQHDYSHHPEGRKGIRQEGRVNLALAGGKAYLFFIRDATHRLTPRGVVRNRETPLSRRLDTFGVLHPWSARPLRLLRRAGQMLGSGSGDAAVG